MGTTTGEILLNCEQGHGRMVINEGENFNAITSSIIFGALADGDGLNLKPYLMAELINQLLGLNEDYLLTLLSSPEEGGQLEGAGVQPAGALIEINATPNTGWAFTNWTNLMGMVVSYEPTFSFAMPASNLTLIANFEPMTGIDEITAIGMRVYPNPANDRIYINTSGEFTGKPYKLLDLTGRVVLSGMISAETMVLDLSQVQAGIYVLNIPENPAGSVKIIRQ